MSPGRGKVPVMLALTAVTVFVALGVWQVERRTWKLQLIARVDQRVHAAPVSAPAAAQWASISASGDEYRRVEVTGEYLSDDQMLAQALTRLGAGYWVMTPLRRPDGTIVWINRGFIPADARAAPARYAAPIGAVDVVGLLRMNEPHGSLLRDNVPAQRRWFSRDVAAMTAVAGFGQAAPYFIDADAGGRGLPAGGLTVISFPNNHLVYALTWFTLAVLGATTLITGRRERQRQPAA